MGITESKLDYTVPDLEVNLPVYDILRYDRNRNVGGATCYIRKDLCFNERPLSGIWEYYFWHTFDKVETNYYRRFLQTSEPS